MSQGRPSLSLIVPAYNESGRIGGPLREMSGEGYEPIAVETSSSSLPFDGFEWPERVCLVMGSEVAGVTGDALAMCDRQVHIPMRGVKESLNVAVAFGIVAHHVSRVLARPGRTVSEEVRA